MEYAILALSIINFAAIIALLIFILRKGKMPVNNEQAVLIGKLENKIENVPSTVNAGLSVALKEEMVRMLKEMNAQSDKDSEKLERFERNINETMTSKFGTLNEQVEKKLNDINLKVEERLGKGFENTTQTFQDVLVRLTKIDEAQKNIEALSGDVVELKTVLSGNQTRGAYGEFTLESILRNVFGETTNLYKLQHVIKQGSSEESTIRPDAVVFLPEPNKLICIDSKFPYLGYSDLFSGELKEEEKARNTREFRAVVKKHIQTIAGKYVISGITSPQALMFIPNDGIFAFIHVTYPELVEESRRLNVIIASPATLQPILSTINLLRIQYERSKQIEEISKHISLLQAEFKRFGTDWTSFSSSVDTLSKKKESFESRILIMNKKFARIASSDSGLDQEVVANSEDLE